MPGISVFFSIILFSFSSNSAKARGDDGNANVGEMIQQCTDVYSSTTPYKAYSYHYERGGDGGDRYGKL